MDDGLQNMRASGWLIITGVWSAITSAMPAAEFKVISWNVLYGFNHGSRVTEGQEWLRKQQPDVVALQELNGFDEKKLAETALAWGHPHSAILKTDGFPVGLTSKTPITVVSRIREGLWHGCLHARTEGTDFLVIHLRPGDLTFRRQEVEILAPLVRALLGEHRRLFALGDFNDKSPLDIEFTNAQEILLTTAKPGNLKDGKYSAEVVGGFMAAGLVDSAAPLPANFSVPTRMKPHADTAVEQAKFLQRIDLILSDPETAKAVRTVHVSQDEVLNGISDHYPVIHSSER
jgi:endonuclease/exonuclease/phosphatase family metal-dependent hydrolase